MQFDSNEIEGATIYDLQGEKIGTVDDLYVDDATGEPEWLLLDTGFFGRDTFVPCRGMRRTEDGFQVAFQKDVVKGAPEIDRDGEELTEEDERDLYSYYRIPYSDQQSETILPEGGSATGQTAPQYSGEHQSDDAMTRSEEVLDVGKVRRPSELVRLRKRIVTENVQKTVPVEREELVVEREPITDENRERALDGPELTESEYETTLEHEEVVTDKHVEPRERVRLDKESATEQQHVDEELRKEEIDVEREHEGRDKRRAA
jgi:uncharacterized protein (TIGR02271 family)